MAQLLGGIISLRRVRGPNPGRSHGSADTLPLHHSANYKNKSENIVIIDGYSCNYIVDNVYRCLFRFSHFGDLSYTPQVLLFLPMSLFTFALYDM